MPGGALGAAHRARRAEPSRAPCLPSHQQRGARRLFNTNAAAKFLRKEGGSPRPRLHPLLSSGRRRDPRSLPSLQSNAPSAPVAPSTPLHARRGYRPLATAQTLGSNFLYLNALSVLSLRCPLRFMPNPEYARTKAGGARRDGDNAPAPCSCWSGIEKMRRGQGGALRTV